MTAELGEIAQVLDQRLVVTVMVVSRTIEGSQEWRQVKGGEDSKYAYVPMDEEKKREQDIFCQELAVEGGPDGQAAITGTVRAIAAVMNGLEFNA